MRISLFSELITPRPWDENTDYRKIQETMEQVELADTFGFSTCWVVEHHFLEEYAHSSAPEVLLGGLSQRTKHLRLGHGIMNLLPQINHPFRAAERIAMLDNMSGGRVEFGSGEGSSVAEIDGFGIDPGIKTQLWEESLSVVVSALSQSPFPGIDGRFLRLPPRNVVPRPYQRPHPPLWMAATRRERIREAARRGLGALCFFFVDPEASREWVEEYYRVFAEECVPIGMLPNPNLAMTSFTMCAETRSEAAARAGANIDFFRFASKHFYQEGTHTPAETDIWELFEASGDAAAARARAGAVTDSSGPTGSAVGTAEDVIDYLRRYEQAGVDEVLLGVQAGHMEHEHIMESIERIGRDVVPQFAERDVAAQTAKAERVAGAVEDAIARRPAPPEAPTDYTHGAILHAWEDGHAVGGIREAMTQLWEVISGERPDVRPADAPDREQDNPTQPVTPTEPQG